MEEQKDLPKPQIDLPLPEKEIPAKTGVEFSILKSKFFIGFVALSFLIAFTVGGFILGRNSVLKELNPTDPTVPPADPVIAMKTYEGKTFNISYPVYWTAEERHWLSNREVDDPNEINTAIFKGDEGEVTVQWGPMGFGGGCDEKDQKQLKIKNKTLKICNGIDENGNEFWSQISNSAKDDESLTGAWATSYKPADQNSKIIIKILSTLEFKDTSVSCTPRPSCFDSIPRCMMPETADMCPPSVTPSQTESTDRKIFCTQEAKQCPDGSYVGRIGPKCEFTTCPTR